MEELKKLKAEIQKLEQQAESGTKKPHPDAPFDNMLENVQRGKFIAYGHVISMINNILTKK